MTALCRVCNAPFEEGQLVEGACAPCRELKARPHASHTVFKSEDLAFQGRRPFPWTWLVMGLSLVALGLILIPEDGGGVSFSGSRETTADAIVGNLDEQDEDFIRELVSAQEGPLLEIFEKVGRAQVGQTAATGTCLTLEELHQSHVVSAHWMEGGDRLYTLSITAKGAEFELRATPEPPFTRHYLMQSNGRVHVNDENPPTAEDPVLRRLVLQKKKP